MAGKREAALPSPDVTLAGSESRRRDTYCDERGSRSVAVKGFDKTGTPATSRSAGTAVFSPLMKRNRSAPAASFTAGLR